MQCNAMYIEEFTRYRKPKHAMCTINESLVHLVYFNNAASQNIARLVTCSIWGCTLSPPWLGNLNQVPMTF